MNSEKQADSAGGELKEQEHKSGATNTDCPARANVGVDVSESFGDISGHSESGRKSSKVKTKVKRKKKRSKGEGGGGDVNAEDDATDTETKPKKSSKEEKKMKKSTSKKKKKKSDDDKDAELSGKKKKTKKKKSFKTTLTISEDVAPNRNWASQDASLQQSIQTTVDTNESAENTSERNIVGSSRPMLENQLAEQPLDNDSANDNDSLELDSDSDVPDPSDLDFDDPEDEETHWVDRTALSLSSHDVKPLRPVPISRNLLPTQLDDDSVDDGHISQASSRSLGVSVAPQDITGSLARDLVDLEEKDPLDPSTHTVLRRRRFHMDRKLWVILLLSILLVVAVIVIIVLATGGGDKDSMPLPIPTAKPTLRPTTIPPIATPEPNEPSTIVPTYSPTVAASGTTPSIDPTEELMNILGLSEELDDAAYLAFQWISSEGWSLETVSHYWLQSRFSLACLYYSTNGSDWDNTDNWVSGSDVCEWFGVVCNTGGEVEELVLEGNNLGATLPTQLGMITTVNHLYLASNNLQSQSFLREFGNLLLLERLDISNNEVTGAIPDELAQLTLLTSLTLNNNHFSGYITSNLGLISHLTTLQLDNNYFSGVIPTELAQLTLLRELTLHTNMLTGNVPIVFQDLLGGLDKVTFHGNDLTGDLDAVFCSSDIKLIPSELTADCISEVVCSCCTSCE